MNAQSTNPQTDPNHSQNLPRAAALAELPPLAQLAYAACCGRRGQLVSPPDSQQQADAAENAISLVEAHAAGDFATLVDIEKARGLIRSSNEPFENVCEQNDKEYYLSLTVAASWALHALWDVLRNPDYTAAAATPAEQVGVAVWQQTRRVEPFQRDFQSLTDHLGEATSNSDQPIPPTIFAELK